MAQYDWREAEPKWQGKWKEWGVHTFDPSSTKPVFSIDNPPRYASGALHLGHAYGYTVIDFAARYKRLKGFNVFFPLCFDVNGTPVEVRVEKLKGIKASEVPRAEFIKMCSEFANKYIGEMTKQFETLGHSMDPSIYYQTDAEYYRRYTQISFIRMFKKGLVYKGHFPVNWCTRCGTALAAAEVDYESRHTKLNFIKFRDADTGREVQVATTRPELLCTCLMVAVNPDDKSKADLVGKELATPVFERRVKVIADPKVDPAFGTGTVMICSIGDKDDLDWIMKYNLPLEKGIDEAGRMTSVAGEFAGMPIKEAREAIIEQMRTTGLLVKQEPLEQNVGTCWRCHTPTEFLKVPQWFVRTLDYREQVLKMIDEVVWKPDFMKVRIKDWVNSLAWDWVVSRQRYFATAIPLWECEKCGDVLLPEEADCYVDPLVNASPKATCSCGGRYVGCKDVFDTWMDSSISPLYNSFWLRDEALFARLYPMTMRPQSHDIIRTWAFYTILREMHLTGKKPWDEVMIHGFIMAPDGRPMHTSDGNVIDPVPLLEKYGGDAMRYYAATCALGMDHAFKEQELVRGQRLATKMWNVMRMVGSACKEKPAKPASLMPVDAWIMSRFGRLVVEVEARCEEYQFDKATSLLEDFLWHEFADHYIELVKNRVYSGDDRGARFTLYTVGLGLLKMMSVVFPHAAEDAYQSVFKPFEEPASVHVSGWPEAPAADDSAERRGEAVKEVVAAVRAWKAAKAISLNAPISRIEVVGAEASSLLGGSEQDVSSTVKAGDVTLMVAVDLKETVTGVKPVHAKIGPAFKRDAKEVVEFLASLGKDAQVPTDGIDVKLKDGRTVRLGPEFYQVQKSMTSERGALDQLSVGPLTVLVYQ